MTAARHIFTFSIGRPQRFRHRMAPILQPGDALPTAQPVDGCCYLSKITRISMIGSKRLGFGLAQQRQLSEPQANAHFGIRDLPFKRIMASWRSVLLSALGYLRGAIFPTAPVSTPAVRRPPQTIALTSASRWDAKSHSHGRRQRTLHSRRKRRRSSA